jgi:DNA-binding transcriptional LysR family regulator
MEIRQVRYFVAVAKELHFGRAATRLYMAQSPLSQQIRKLEHELGVELFDRTGRHVTLTSAGAAFLPEAHLLLRQTQRAQDAARLHAESASGTMSLGCASSAFYEVLPRLISELRRQRPQVSVTVRELKSVDAITEVANQRLDVAIVHLASQPPEVETQILRAEPLAVAMPAEHPLASRREIPVAFLRTERFVHLPRELLPEIFDSMIAACRAEGFSPDLAHEARSFLAQIGLVACKLGIALLPNSARSFAVPGVVFRPLSPPSVLPDLSLMWNPRRTPPGLSVLRECGGWFGSPADDDLGPGGCDAGNTGHSSTLDPVEGIR